MTTLQVFRKSENTTSSNKYALGEGAIASHELRVYRLRTSGTTFSVCHCSSGTEVLHSHAKKGPVKEFLKGQVRKADGRIFVLYRELEQMLNLQFDWNGYGSESPNEIAIEAAKEIVLTAPQLGMIPNKILPSAEGGVGICFYASDRYADIECLNTGEILAMKSDGVNRPEIWELMPNQYKGALEEIREYLR